MRGAAPSHILDRPHGRSCLPSTDGLSPTVVSNCVCSPAATAATGWRARPAAGYSHRHARRLEEWV